MEPSDQQPQAREVMARRYVAGTTVTNCVSHIGLPITERPDDCPLCLSDLRNFFTQAAEKNAWLNAWREDALTVLTRQELALATMQGFEARERVDGEGFDVVRETIGGDVEILVEAVPPMQAKAVEAFCSRVLEHADGITELMIPATPEGAT